MDAWTWKTRPLASCLLLARLCSDSRFDISRLVPSSSSDTIVLGTLCVLISLDIHLLCPVYCPSTASGPYFSFFSFLAFTTRLFT
ncbi:hypothetical protein SODALDRAFT_209882 [Sodiomyces alkalinus F11]|uniref:Uncharacterized protein n=1 Tax=Sodiomyces alkalinus (strain CBS 110278 / VKM F-3762 / F11) TaxID=1314773 RepID=A0A3N2PQY8_SODAK|nr:hypothetical protein SODALDRAFT_209882 [Sodiomyces alkalinus F11]ROT36898.1 hypothetical protein SODALDRAFT_209882 [Sodiomyces alkalinus F11]